MIIIMTAYIVRLSDSRITKKRELFNVFQPVLTKWLQRNFTLISRKQTNEKGLSNTPLLQLVRACILLSVTCSGSLICFLFFLWSISVFLVRGFKHFLYIFISHQNESFCAFSSAFSSTVQTPRAGIDTMLLPSNGRTDQSAAGQRSYVMVL